MGPVLIFDKSVLESLNPDEAVWLDQFFLANITPLFFVETLADLQKNTRRGRSPEDIVGSLAYRTPDLHSKANVHHRTLLEGELSGEEKMEMDGRPVIGGGRYVELGGQTGAFFEASPEEEAMKRWQEHKFLELEHFYAQQWRTGLSNVDLEEIYSYYQKAFTQCWNNPQIVAVTPFLLNYQEPPFDQFSFKKHETKLAKSETQSIDDPYFPAYRVLQDFPKASGRPVQEVKAELLKGEIFTSIVAGEAYMIDLTFKNIGQSIWNDREQVRLVATEGGQNFGITNLELPKNIKVEPGQEYTFRLNLKAPLEMSARQNNVYKTTLNLFEGNRQFDSKPLESETEVKSPVILKIKSSLGWKNNFAGNYILTIKGATGSNIQNIKLDGRGMSDAIEARYLLPDYSFEFSLEKPFYKPSKITQTVSAGENTLNFGSLKPDIFSVLLNPKELWKLLPFSN